MYTIGMNTEHPDPSKLASYIVVRKRLPVGMKAVSACHAAVALHLRFHDRPEYADWLSYSFKKRIVEVSDEKFEAAKQIADHVVMKESTLDGLETAIAFCPRHEWPKFFKNLSLMR